MGHKQKPVLSSRVREDLLERIDALVDETGLSRADVIERALDVGLKDQEAFVSELRGEVVGPLMELLLNEKFLNVVGYLVGQEADPERVKAVKTVRDKVRARAAKLDEKKKGKPTTE